VVLYGRFLVLTALFALTVLAAVVAVSALAGGVRAALSLSVLLVVTLVLGFDLGIVAGLTSGVIGSDTLGLVVSSTPNSAYRGLVLDLVVDPATSADGDGSPVVGLLALLAWLIGPLLVGWHGVWASVEHQRDSSNDAGSTK
jgi:ABC-2 type transport system permease protein